MLYDEAFLFASFEMKIDQSWCSLSGYKASDHSQDAQTEFIASFEDLLKRQTRLYKSFDMLLIKLNDTNHVEEVGLLGSYETLLRLESNLFMSFDRMLSWKYLGTGSCP